MNDNLNRIVGKELMLLRIDKGITIEELSNITKIATSTISRYENGTTNMSLDYINNILVACNTTADIFFAKCVAKMQK